ncbi:MAG TPA: hypothetical protein HA306_06870, partial [Methanosarcina sp.]|nr:hypothetical protein [Methanosarcina sp.]
MEKKLPEGWKLVELKDYAYFQEGPGIRKWQFTNKGIKLLNVRNLVNGELDLNNTERYVSEEEAFGKYEHFLLNPDEIVMASSGVTWGKTAIVRSEHLPLMLNTSTIRFRSLNRQILDQSYLLHYLNSELFSKQIERLITGSAQPNFGPSHLIQVELILPPLEVQKKIVSILEKAEETKKLRAQADDLTQKLLQSVFLEMFGDPVENPKNWDEWDLENLLDEDPQNGLYKPSTDYGEGIPILRIDSFYDGKISNIEKLKRLNCTPEEIHKYGLNIGEVLINRVNSLEYLGKCGLVETLFEPTVFESNMMRLKLKISKVNPEYLTSFLCTQYIKNQILQKAKKAVNQASINQSDVKSLKILIPPMELQHNYSHIIKQIEKTTESQKQSSLEINNLFDALMQKAFSGELVS